MRIDGETSHEEDCLIQSLVLYTSDRHKQNSPQYSQVDTLDWMGYFHCNFLSSSFHGDTYCSHTANKIFCILGRHYMTYSRAECYNSSLYVINDMMKVSTLQYVQPDPIPCCYNRNPTSKNGWIGRVLLSSLVLQIAWTTEALVGNFSQFSFVN